ncbi:MAG: hypothetical protein B6230_05015 [Desulfobacteraceae bacterium 4572_89]|nr:MAG: hypothetical protein B6230_05015 [Desulfobacteraceae bacterium 4572_89]
MGVFPGKLSGAGKIFCLAVGICLITGSLLIAATPETGKPMVENFPVHDSIKPNVAFWTDIFTRYTRSQGVIHDARNLGRIYGVISLDTARTRTAEKNNEKKKKSALEAHKKILLNLASGKSPRSQKEKKIAKLFPGKAGPEHFKQAARELRIQTGLARQFKEGLIRSGAVIEKFKEIFISHGLPVDLVYLPCVESSFDFTAYSKFGAAGVWQFTRGTGKLYMEIGYVVDQRRDPFISTRSAALLLKRNYKKLGEWPMAITAYNHGLNGMVRAKKQKPSKFHRVKKGDTAGAIARIHSVPLKDLILANGLSRRATVYIGQNLRIPVQGEIIIPKKQTIPESSVPLPLKTESIQSSH